MVINFSPARIRELPAPVSGNVIHYDTEVRGLGLRITKNNARSFVFNYRVKGIERRLTIGSLSDWPLKVVRDEARRLRRIVDQLADPADALACITRGDRPERQRVGRLGLRRPWQHGTSPSSQVDSNGSLVY